jgi:hypothetical protein
MVSPLLVSVYERVQQLDLLLISDSSIFPDPDCIHEKLLSWFMHPLHMVVAIISRTSMSWIAS